MDPQTASQAETNQLVRGLHRMDTFSAANSGYPADCGRQVRCGLRQPMPSSMYPSWDAEIAYGSDLNATQHTYPPQLV